jgi:hypothetical protein
MKIQVDKKLKEIHLECLVEAHWFYWYTSLKKIILCYTEIKEVLEVLTVQGEQTARVIGLLEDFSSFQFVLILHIMEQFLNTACCLSSEL